MEKARKEEVVSALSEVFKEAQIGFLLDFRGMSAEKNADLRRKLNGAQAQMRVLKNRLAKRAAQGTPYESIVNTFTETRAFVYAQDPVSTAKVVDKFLADNEKVQFVTGFLVKGDAGQALNRAQVKALANLPSREELLVKMLYVFNAKQTSLVRTLNEVPSKFVRTLAALAEKKGKAA